MLRDRDSPTSKFADANFSQAAARHFCLVLRDKQKYGCALRIPAASHEGGLLPGCTKNTATRWWPYFLAPGQGFEPQFSGSEPDVLPLDDPGRYFIEYLLFFFGCPEVVLGVRRSIVA